MVSSRGQLLDKPPGSILPLWNGSSFMVYKNSFNSELQPTAQQLEKEMLRFWCVWKYYILIWKPSSYSTKFGESLLSLHGEENTFSGSFSSVCTSFGPGFSSAMKTKKTDLPWHKLIPARHSSIWNSSYAFPNLHIINISRTVYFCITWQSKARNGDQKLYTWLCRDQNPHPERVYAAEMGHTVWQFASTTSRTGKLNLKIKFRHIWRIPHSV